MAKFMYRMQNILDIKSKLESQAKTSYAHANFKLKQEEEQLRHLYRRKSDYENQAKQLLGDRLNVLAIKTCRHAIDAMKSEVRTQMITVHVAQKNVDAAREKLNEAMIDRKTHEKLKDNAFEEFKKEVEVEEGKEIDQLVSYVYGTKKVMAGE